MAAGMVFCIISTKAKKSKAFRPHHTPPYSCCFFVSGRSEHCAHPVNRAVGVLYVASGRWQAAGASIGSLIMKAPKRSAVISDRRSSRRPCCPSPDLGVQAVIPEYAAQLRASSSLRDAINE
jgi:hypothetical protein